MIEIICEYVVREKHRGQFELAYGPGGAWSRLFSRCEGYRGTTVLRDESAPVRYLVIDIWDSVAQRDRALAEGEAEYLGLTRDLDEWVESRSELGVFGMLAQATVRPRGRPEQRGRRGRRGVAEG